MVTPVTITKQFNGDAAAVDFVNAAALDTQLGNLATTVNAEIIERQRTVKDGAGLVDQVVRYRSLHPEVITSLSGVVFLQGAAAATTVQNTLSGLQVIDGYTTISGDRILVNNQSDQTQNGIYLALAGAWTRTTDASGALTTTSVVSIINGASYSGSMWRLSANATLGSSINSWILLQGGTPILPVNRGGTGANTAANARTNLGLGSIAVLNSIAQANITDGAVNQLKTANDVQYQVDTIALLKAEAVNSHKTIYVRGYYASGDNGGGFFIWNASDATADNGGTVIIPNSAPGTGRWNRINTEVINVRWFGAVGDGTANDTTPCQTALALSISTSKKCYFPAGSYRITSTLSASGATIVGDGPLKTYIQATVARAQTISANSFNMITFSGTAPAQISGLQIHGGWNGSTASLAGDGIICDNGTPGTPFNITISDVWVQYCCRNGVTIHDGGYSRINSVRCNASGLDGLYIYGDSGANLSTTTQISGMSVFSDCPNGYGMHLKDVANINANGVVMEYTKGIQLEGNNNRAVSFIGCYQENTTGGQFITYGTSAGLGLSIIGCYGGNCVLSYAANWYNVTTASNSAINNVSSLQDVTDIQSAETVTAVTGSFTALTISVPPGTWMINAQLFCQDAGSATPTILACVLTTSAADSGYISNTNVNYRRYSSYVSSFDVSKAARVGIRDTLQNTTTAAVTWYLRGHIALGAGSLAWRAFSSLERVK